MKILQRLGLVHRKDPTVVEATEDLTRGVRSLSERVAGLDDRLEEVVTAIREGNIYTGPSNMPMQDMVRGTYKVQRKKPDGTP